jgi:Pyridoxamine 5'-phosphate oxidase
MSIAMTKDEREQFLAEVHVGILCIPDGARGPLSVPIWYDYEPGGEIALVTGADSRKGRLLEAGRRVSFVAQHEGLPPRYVSVEGPVVSLERASLDDLRAMARRYLGAEIGDRYIEATRDVEGAPEDVLVRIRPERWLSADFAKRFAQT